MSRNYYIIDRVEENQESVSIFFNYEVIFDHAKIVDAFRTKGQTFLEKFTVTIGGYKTPSGFQYTIRGFDNPSRGTAYEKTGQDYPIDLPEGHIISELIFSHTMGKVKYCVKIVADLMHIQPRPNRDLVDKYIRILKDALTTSHLVYLQNAKEVLISAKTEFLKGAYHSCAHNIYYSLFNIIKALAVREGRKGKIPHGGAAEEILRELVKGIKDGTYSALSRNDSDDRKAFQNLDVERYIGAVRDAYRIRQTTDYTSSFEAGAAREEMSKLISITEELVTISDYVLNGFTRTSSKSKQLILHSPYQDEDKMYPSDLLENEFIRLRENKLLLTGFISGDFNANEFAYSFLLRKRILFTDVTPSKNSHLFAKYENGRKLFEISSIKTKPQPADGYIHLIGKNVAKWSAIIKPHKLKELSHTKNDLQVLDFLYSKYFYSLHILPDGRLYLMSDINGRNFGKQLSATERLKDILVKSIPNKWKNQSSVLFSPINIVQPSPLF